jgi:DNA replication ATP-dependent helicase Dna2
MMNMHQKIMSELIEATEQEIRRLQEPKNRSRYFIFGKVDEWHSIDGYSVTFENVPDRVLQDAIWAARRCAPSLFRVGDIFISGIMKITPQGIRILFSAGEINRLNIDIEAIKQITDIGIDYIMDNRKLTEQLLGFLKSKVDLENQFLEPLTQYTEVICMKSIGSQIADSDLNSSQKKAIEKALSQKVTFFWGPPGTGKTKTMGALGANLIKNKKRVLLTSLSNMALDQLLLTTLERLGRATSNISIARLGSNMNEKCQGFSQNAFRTLNFNTTRAGMLWSEHVKHSSLVAGNFAMLTSQRLDDLGQFDYVIADEVSMVSIPSLIAASFFATAGIVVGGDPYQLPPIYTEDTEEPNEWFRTNVFEKAKVTTRDDPRSAFLDTQYRMQDKIGDLVSEMFYKDVGGLKTGTEPLDPIRGFNGRVVFIHSPGVVETVGAGYLHAEAQRRFNEVHAESVAKAVCKAIRQGVRPSDIGIIAPYNAQVLQILQKLRQVSTENDLVIDGLKVSTVHSFQGQERRVIVVDFTDDNVRPTHLTAKRQLINVALSRAKEQLIIVGNHDYLISKEYFNEKEIEIFERLLKHCKSDE